jgi:hypothetical protein
MGVSGLLYARPFCPRGIGLRYTLDRRLGEHRGGLKAVGRETFFFLLGIEPRFLSRPACTLVTIPNELSRFLFVNHNLCSFERWKSICHDMWYVCVAIGGHPDRFYMSSLTEPLSWGRGSSRVPVRFCILGVLEMKTMLLFSNQWVNPATSSPADDVQHYVILPKLPLTNRFYFQ